MIMIRSEVRWKLVQVGFGYRIGDLQNFCPDGCFQFSSGRALGVDRLRVLWATMWGAGRWHIRTILVLFQAIFKPYPMSGPETSSGLINALEKSRIVLQPIIEPFIF